MMDEASLEASDEHATFVIIEDPLDPGQRVAVFSDGSYARWIPGE